ncbi:MAG: hypothetical protein PHN88_00345 [Ignavibacteria bacterium]|nr:hypothetical protein [Ignavibacteria bacterium]
MSKNITTILSSAFLLLSLFLIPAYSQNNDFDTKYTAEYVMKDIRGSELGRLKLYRNNNKLRFSKTENKGKDDEISTDVYVFKDENKAYLITSTKKIKLGFGHSSDLMTFVGMLTGIYILDLGNDGTIFNPSIKSGTDIVLGRECFKYTIMTAPDGGSFYWMFQDNLMLKRTAATSTDGTIFEAISYEPGIDVPESMFVLPADVQFVDN